MDIKLCDKCKKRINTDKHKFIFIESMRVSEQAEFHGGSMDFCSIDCLIKYLEIFEK
jgi:hypothetical protein